MCSLFYSTHAYLFYTTYKEGGEGTLERGYYMKHHTAPFKTTLFDCIHLIYRRLKSLYCDLQVKKERTLN